MKNEKILKHDQRQNFNLRRRVGCLTLVFWSVWALFGCQPSSTTEQKNRSSSAQKNSAEHDLQTQFSRWKAKQDPKLLDDYYQYIAQNMKNPPSLMELTTTRNFMPEHCLPLRFGIPPRKYWKNMVGSLQLVEKLNHIDFYQHYTITAIYRNPALNACVSGASRSKHIYNYAVDFHVLKPKETDAAARETLVQKMCSFWQKEGKNFKMGLGVYGNNRYHIDTQGYRTWGKDYSSKTSPCLTH